MTINSTPFLYTKYKSPPPHENGGGKIWRRKANYAINSIEPISMKVPGRVSYATNTGPL